MLNLPVSPQDAQCLECGRDIEEVLVEAIYVELGIIEREVVDTKDNSGWKALGKPERERILRILEMLGHGINDLLELLE